MERGDIRVLFQVFCHTWATWMRQHGGLDTFDLVRTDRWTDPESADRYAHVVVSEQARRADLLSGAKKVGRSVQNRWTLKMPEQNQGCAFPHTGEVVGSIPTAPTSLPASQLRLPSQRAWGGQNRLSDRCHVGTARTPFFPHAGEPSSTPWPTLRLPACAATGGVRPSPPRSV
jgi:hypothetical protein